MPDMTSATPRPWTFNAGACTADGSRDKICLTGFSLAMGGPHHEASANTTIVIRAVNSFDALVAAAREGLALAEACEPSEHDPDYAAMIEAVRSKLRAALALAGEKETTNA